MKITDAKYRRDIDTKEILSIVAKIDDKYIIIPPDPANRHYAEILKQVEEGKLKIKDEE